MSTEKATVSASDEDSIADLMEQHDQFLSSTQARLAKLQVLIIEIVVMKIESFAYYLTCIWLCL